MRSREESQHVRCEGINVVAPAASALDGEDGYLRWKKSVVLRLHVLSVDARADHLAPPASGKPVAVN